jgi:hypothetical protein
LTQVLQQKDKVALILLEKDDEYIDSGIIHNSPPKLHIFDVVTHVNSTFNNISFKSHAVPLDFDGRRLIWNEFNHDKSCTLKMMDTMNADYTVDIITTSGRAEHINFAYLF